MTLRRRTFLQLAASAAALPAMPHVTRAQAWPSRPVRILVGFAAGGNFDIVARLIGQWLWSTDLLGGQVQVLSEPLPASIQHIKSGVIRGLAVTTATRAEALPDVPR